jgi:hypothetical protein
MVCFHTGRQDEVPTKGSIDFPCISNGMLFIGSRDGILYYFENIETHLITRFNVSGQKSKIVFNGIIFAVI